MIESVPGPAHMSAIVEQDQEEVSQQSMISNNQDDDAHEYEHEHEDKHEHEHDGVSYEDMAPSSLSDRTKHWTGLSSKPDEQWTPVYSSLDTNSGLSSSDVMLLHGKNSSISLSEKETEKENEKEKDDAEIDNSGQRNGPPDHNNEFNTVSHSTKNNNSSSVQDIPVEIDNSIDENENDYPLSTSRHHEKSLRRSNQIHPAPKSKLLLPIVFQDIWFRYQSRLDKWVLKGFCLTIEPGQTIALVGSSGGGKSTVISLLENFYVPAYGTIQWGGIDISTLDPTWYHRNVRI